MEHKHIWDGVACNGHVYCRECLMKRQFADPYTVVCRTHGKLGRVEVSDKVEHWNDPNCVDTCVVDRIYDDGQVETRDVMRWVKS